MNNIRDLRLSLGMTQPQLAALLREADRRIDTGMVSRFETGVCYPTEPVLCALESALQAHRGDIYSEAPVFTSDDPAGSDAILDASAPVQTLVKLLGDRKHPMTRAELARRMGMSDRTMRKTIQQARMCGYLILNDQDGRGYYLGSDTRDMERQYRQDTSRALSVLKRRKPLREKLKETGYPV